MTNSLRDQFLLDPDVVYLNHGSYGACPQPVFDRYQAWQRELEWNPVAFLGRRVYELLEETRGVLGAYLGVDGDTLVLFPNPTTAIRLLLRALPFDSGDEVLTTDWEYPSTNAAWDLAAYQHGLRYIHQPVPVPFTAPEEFVDALWAGVTDRTRVIFLSHISFTCALVFPVAEVCRRARTRGILTVIDGAHAPSQIPLDLAALDADIYLGACHKWLCAPKGSGFAYAHPSVHALLTEPLILGNSRRGDTQPGPGQYVPQYQYQGTRDPAACLTVPDAIRFQAEHNWDAQRERCHALARQTLQRITDLTGLPPLSPDSNTYYSQMVSIPLPTDRVTAVSREMRKRNIVAPILSTHGRSLVRVSYQAYNDQTDADALVDAVQTALAQPQDPG